MFYFNQRKNLRITATGSGTISFAVTIAYGSIDALRSMEKPGFDYLGPQLQILCNGVFGDSVCCKSTNNDDT